MMEWLKYILIGISLLVLIVYFGLPRALHALGLHPSYNIPPFDLEGKRALVITTSHDTLGETGKATGVFGSEMSVPYYAFLDAGMEVDIASIQGGEVPVEPHSMGWPLATPEDRRFTKDPAAMAKLKNSIPISQIDPAKYDVYYMAGGWGAAYDLAQSDELADVITKANANGKILSSVCHGALGPRQRESRRWLIAHPGTESDRRHRSPNQAARHRGHAQASRDGDAKRRRKV
jgi:hypothetical protein